MSGCSPSLRFNAAVVPRYLCGDTSPAITWTANQPVRVSITDATNQVLYDSKVKKASEFGTALGAITAASLPLTGRVDGGRSKQTLDVQVLDGESWLPAVEPTMVDYGVYEQLVNEEYEQGQDQAAPGMKPATDPGPRVYRCKNRAANNGLCLDNATSVQLWEIGIAVRGLQWKLHDVFAPHASVREIVNTTKFSIRVGDQAVPPGASLTVQGDGAPTDMVIQADVESAVRVVCGIERRFSDGRCLAAEGMAECRQDSDDARLAACAVPQLRLKVRAACDT